MFQTTCETLCFELLYVTCFPCWNYFNDFCHCNKHTHAGGIEDQNRKESKDEPALEDHSHCVCHRFESVCYHLSSVISGWWCMRRVCLLFSQSSWSYLIKYWYLVSLNLCNFATQNIAILHICNPSPCYLHVIIFFFLLCLLLLSLILLISFSSFFLLSPQASVVWSDCLS